MLPEPIRLGPLAFSYYGLMVAVGVLAALALFSVTAPRRGLAPGLTRDFCFWMVLAGLLGSRIFYVLFHLSEFAGTPSAMFAYWRGGLMFQGGVVLALAVAPVFLKRYGLPGWATADVMAPSLALGQSFGRLGCLAAGCCYGRPTANPESPLGLVFPEGSLAPPGLSLRPAQIIESAGLLILAAILVWAIRSNRRFFSRPGRVAGLYLLGAGLMRLTMELFFRGDFRGEPLWGLFPPTTLAAILAAAAGLIIILTLKPAVTARNDLSNNG